jgi:hypothetical protein
MTRATAWVLVALLLLTGVVAAQDKYDLTWWTVDGGGYTYSFGTGYALGGSIGQPDAGLLEGEGYRLGGGFWGGGAAARYRLYLPMVLR